MKAITFIAIALAALVTSGLTQVETYEWTNFSCQPGGSGSANGAGNDTRFTRPSGVAFDRYGNASVADSYNHTVRKITPGGVVSTMAGKAGVPGNADGIREEARFYTPTDIAVDDKGNVFVTDFTNNLIRKISPEGVVSTYSGDRINGSGSTDNPISNARFSQPAGIDIDAAGNLFIAETGNHSIRKTNTSGVISNVSGGNYRYPGSANGGLENAIFRNPSRLAIDTSNNIYVADRGNVSIRKITSTTVSSLAGVVTSAYYDGTGSGAAFSFPNGLILGTDGNLRLADSGNYAIRQINPAGVVTTFVGGSVNPIFSTPISGTADGAGTAAQFNGPFDLAYDSDGNLIVVNSTSNTIRKASPAGVVTTIGGTPGVVGSAGGVGSAGLFSMPRGVTAIGADIYISDTGNNRIVKGVKKGFRPLLDCSEITDLGTTTATLHGTVNPNGSATTASFQYGFTASLGSSAAISLSPGNDLATQTVSVSLNGLTPGSAYFYRLNATNTAGTSFTRMGHFITPTPIIEVESPETQVVNGVKSLDFDSSAIDQPSSQTVFVKNPGNVPLAVQSIAMIGDNPGDFQIAVPVAAPIAPGESVAMQIHFAPVVRGMRRAVVRVASSDPAKPTVDVALTGVGLTPSGS